MGKRLTIVLATLAAIPLLYVGAYLALVRAVPVTMMEGDGPWPKVPSYRFGGEMANGLFTPVQAADARIRPRYWKDTD